MNVKQPSRYIRTQDISDQALHQAEVIGKSWMVVGIWFEEWDEKARYRETVHFKETKEEAQQCAKELSEVGWNARVVPPISGIVTNHVYPTGCWKKK